MARSRGKEFEGEISRSLKRLLRSVPIGTFWRVPDAASVGRRCRTCKTYLMPKKGTLSPGDFHLVIDGRLTIVEAKSATASETSYMIRAVGGPQLDYMRDLAKTGIPVYYLVRQFKGQDRCWLLTAEAMGALHDRTVTTPRAGGFRASCTWDELDAVATEVTRATKTMWDLQALL